MGNELFKFIKESGFIEFALYNLSLSLVIAICVAIAIKIDTKAHNIKNGNIWTCLGFFFGFVAGFIYLISRKKLIEKAPSKCSSCGASTPTGSTTCVKCNSTELTKVNNFTKKKKIICIVLIIIAVATSVSSRAINTYFHIDDKLIDNMISSIDNLNFENIDLDSFNHKAYHPNNTDEFDYYYDMKKNPYIDNFEVVYYTEDGTEYIYEYRSDGDGLISIENNEFHNAKECFVNKEGYLIFDDSLYDSVDEYNHSAEKDGETYYLAGYVSWDKNGNLVDNLGNRINLE